MSSSPVMPSFLAAQSRQRYGASMAGRYFLPASFDFDLLALLQVVEKLQEHDPGEHRQPVQVAVEAPVLPHDVAGGLDEAAELLGRGQGLIRLSLTSWPYASIPSSQCSS